ncbi:LPS export ABC transporter permease LptF [Amylibacter marinus]|uniref:LPS export ABC transporter permease LptF n=1 Tax=Amylibacter marinus TaxID=1475483 RepID=A0ABQ5VRT9_9RHOB|nr:LPS export ABC transporter permease LptF [Amylibacter marinus]
MQGLELKKLDRYILGQLLGPFFFFCLVFAGILWLNQALAIVDIVIDNGQPASVFVKLSLLLFPKVMESTIPIAGFAASIFVTNKLFGESELVVMMSAGRSNHQLTKPFFTFGMICLVLMLVMVHFVNPWAKTEQLDRRDEIRRQFITQIIQPGEFISDQDRYTFFFGEKFPNGLVRDVLIEERISDTETVTHIAKQGQVVNEDGQITLVLFEGSIQRLQRGNNNLSLVQFDSLAFDLSSLGGDIPARESQISELSTPALLAHISGMEADLPALIRAQTLLHERISITLLVLLAPALGMATLLLGGFSRSGFLPRIGLGVLLMAGINSLRGAAESWGSVDIHSWPMIYVPIIVTIGLILLLIWLGTKDLKTLFRLRKDVFGAAT